MLVKGATGLTEGPNHSLRQHDSIHNGSHNCVRSRIWYSSWLVCTSESMVNSGIIAHIGRDINRFIPLVASVTTWVLKYTAKIFYNNTAVQSVWWWWRSNNYDVISCSTTCMIFALFRACFAKYRGYQCLISRSTWATVVSNSSVFSILLPIKKQTNYWKKYMFYRLRYDHIFI